MAFSGNLANPTYRSKMLSLESLALNLYGAILGHVVFTPTADTEVALDVTLKFLLALWCWNNPRWRSLRHKVQLSLIKDTEVHGNTSVSMGTAVNFYNEFMGTGITSNFCQVLFLNCGSGGIKYQLYHHKDGHNGAIYLVNEYKPKKGAAVADIFNEGGIEKVSALMNKEFSSFMKQNEIYLNALSVFAFITGSIRQKWEESTPEEAKAMNDRARSLFATLQVDGEELTVDSVSQSFFITQEDEGFFELVGSKQMLTNLQADNLISTGSSQISCLGIGNGTCQFGIGDAEPGHDIQVLGHSAGMQNLAGLLTMPVALMKQLDDPAKAKHFLDLVAATAIPVITLKSGCTLLLENKDSVTGVTVARILSTPSIEEGNLLFEIKNPATGVTVARILSTPSMEEKTPFLGNKDSTTGVTVARILSTPSSMEEKTPFLGNKDSTTGVTVARTLSTSSIEEKTPFLGNKDSTTGVTVARILSTSSMEEKTPPENVFVQKETNFLADTSDLVVNVSDPTPCFWCGFQCRDRVNFHTGEYFPSSSSFSSSSVEMDPATVTTTSKDQMLEIARMLDEAESRDENEGSEACTTKDKMLEIARMLDEAESRDENEDSGVCTPVTILSEEQMAVETARMLAESIF